MKVTGYKIKEILKLIERLQEDFKLVGIYLPKSQVDDGDAYHFEKSLNDTFEKQQILAEDVSRLKMIQLKYNMLVSVGTEMSLADAIQQTSKISGLSTKLEKLLKEVEASEGGITLNRDWCEPSQSYPTGRSPRYHVPAISVDNLKKILRKFRAEETRMKNLVGYGNSVEVDMLGDSDRLHYLFDEKRLENFDLKNEKVRIAAENDPASVTRVVIDELLTLDTKFIEKVMKDVPDVSEDEQTSHNL